MSDYENEIADHTNLGKAKKFMHVTKNGDAIALSKLEDSHLQNIINLLQRKSKEGVKVRYGGGSTADDIWYDEDMLYGEEALKHLHYGEYVAEQKRRLTKRVPDVCHMCRKSAVSWDEKSQSYVCAHCGARR